MGLGPAYFTFFTLTIPAWHLRELAYSEASRL